MRSLNRFTCIGNLTKTLDVKNVGELVIASGSIAVNDKVGEKEETTYINFKAFGKLAELMGLYTQKGSKVYLEGKLKNNNYDKKDGSGKVYGYELMVDDFLLLDKKESENKEA